MFVSGYSYSPVGPIPLIRVVLSEYGFGPLLVHTVYKIVLCQLPINQTCQQNRERTNSTIGNNIIMHGYSGNCSISNIIHEVVIKINNNDSCS